MGKVFDKRAALGNHQRQRAQATMMLHGWVPFKGEGFSYSYGAGALHEESGRMVRKDAATGKASLHHYRSSYPTIPITSYIEWDEVATSRVLWLYKILLREKMI